MNPGEPIITPIDPVRERQAIDAAERQGLMDPADAAVARAAINTDLQTRILFEERKFWTEVFLEWLNSQLNESESELIPSAPKGDCTAYACHQADIALDELRRRFSSPGGGASK